MSFPRKRFHSAGATAAELDALEQEHARLPENMRAVNEKHFASLDTAGLRQALNVRRAAGIPASLEEDDVEFELPDIDDPTAVRAMLDGEQVEEVLDSFTRKQLNEIAGGVGVDHPEKLDNKGAVIDAIIQAHENLTTRPDTGGDAEPGPDGD
jgi:hypothetical protein